MAWYGCCTMPNETFLSHNIESHHVLRIRTDKDRLLRARFLAVAIGMEQPIVGFHQDEAGDWVADLACGHTQHVRHNPPFSNRPWVLTPEGRRRFVGFALNCKLCDEGQ